MKKRKTKKPGYATLHALSILLAIGAVLTIVPSPMAYRECLLGYKAHCTFAPFSTLACVILAAANCTLRRRLFTTEEA